MPKTEVHLISGTLGKREKKCGILAQNPPVVRDGDCVPESGDSQYFTGPFLFPGKCRRSDTASRAGSGIAKSILLPSPSYFFWKNFSCGTVP
jgi:hypothetical protein